MSKLEEIFNDLSVSVFKAKADTIDSLMADGKNRTKDLFLAHLYGLKAMLEDPSMNARTPTERLSDVIEAVEQL